MSSQSTTPPATSPSLTRKRPRRPSNVSADEPTGVIVGNITINNKFLCVDPACAGLSFNRQADFRRHYQNSHDVARIEYFCQHKGCSRSRQPQGRSKGKSFGAREDKMWEHMRTVHEKKKRKSAFANEDDDGDDAVVIEDEDYGERVVQRPAKRKRAVDGYGRWKGLEG